MPLINDVEMTKNIKSNIFHNQYFLYGVEYSIIEKNISRIVKKNLKNDNIFNYQKFNDKSSFAEISESLDSLPMMSDKKIVLIKNFDLKSLSEKEFKELLSLLEDVNELLIVIFCYVNCEIDFKLAKYKKIIDQITKTGVVCNYVKKDYNSLKKYIVSTCEKFNITINPTNINVLIERCHESLSAIINELDKLCYYCENREMTKADIEKICPMTFESTVFDLSNAILSKKPAKAFNLLEALFYQRVESIAIVGAINNNLIDIYRAKLGIIAKKDAKSIVEDFSYAKNREFVVKNAMTTASRFDVETFHKWFDILYKTDKKLKSSKVDDTILLEQMIGYLIEI